LKAVTGLHVPFSDISPQKYAPLISRLKDGDE
jgi:hypothetical protein